MGYGDAGSGELSGGAVGGVRKMDLLIAKNPNVANSLGIRRIPPRCYDII